MTNTILLVEDEEIMLRFLKQRLIKENFETDIAVDGKQAIEFIDTKAYSLIISDLMLPFVSGFELITKIRSSTHNNATPLLILSALSAEDIIVEAINIGATDFLRKPFSMDVLVAKVKQLTEEAVHNG
ncbi:MAG: response regulator [Pedobacter sp.]|nr:MAG: response regulator [Pedobacter sp.]